MLIKEMFAKPIDREIQGVIVVGQGEKDNVQQELEEYVVTKELQKHFADFFASYKKGIVGNTPKMGVWISGFFGSGKSHFLKILSYLLENREVGGKHALDYFVEDNKIVDALVLADMQLAANTPTDVVLFNIDAKSDTGAKENHDAIVNVFLKVFNEIQGFCGAMPLLADLERKLTEEGRFTEFKENFSKTYGDPWEASRQDFAFIQDTIVDVLAEMKFMSEQAGRNWCEKAIAPYRISIEDFAKRVKAYLDQKGKNHHLVFLVDEVGQYIGDDSKLMLNMQTVTEELGKECGGKVWVLVTSQQDIDAVTKVKGNDFSKIQGRFDTRLSLSSANVDAVIKKRILEKNDTAAQMLRLLYNQKSTIIKNLIVFNDGVEKKLYADQDDFSRVYPFVPYQFNLLAGVLTSIRTHGASGKHLSEGERSMLAMFKESAMAYMGENEGAIVPFHAFYDALVNFLDHSHRGVIQKAYDNSFVNPEKKENNVFAINVLKTLFMIKYVDSITANIDNITSLMITHIDDDRIALREEVESALKVLIRQMLVQRNGEIYIFLTDEEQEINREIASQNVEMAEVLYKVSKMIFEDIFTENKYRYPGFNGRYAFAYNQIVDERPNTATQHYDIGIHILTPAFPVNDDASLRMMSGQKNEVLVVLPDDHVFMDEIQTYLKIEKFLSLNTSSALPKYVAIKEARRLEMKERDNTAKIFLTEALKKADIYVNGGQAQIGEKEVSSRINEAVELLVKTVYNKLSYIDKPMGEHDIKKAMHISNDLSLDLDGGQAKNTHALDDVRRFIADNTQRHMKTSMKTVKERFMKAPYGFVEDDVHWLVAWLFKRGDLAFSVNGASVTMQNKSEEEIINLITKKAYVEKLLMEQRIRVTEKDKKIVREVMKKLFQTSGVSEDEDSMMANFISYSKSILTELGQTEIRYESGAYPGRQVVKNGKRLLFEIVQVQSPLELFHLVVKQRDDLLDFAEDYEPLKGFFAGEQREIFDESLGQMAIYEDSKSYIVDPAVETVVAAIQDILHQEKPYNQIAKLLELLGKFRDAYRVVLDEQEAPVLATIEESRQRVFEILDTKTYRETKSGKYFEQFEEIKAKAQSCNNVSRLRGFADQAEALKLRLLNEMDQLDVTIARENAEKEAKRLMTEAEKKGQAPAMVAEPPIVYHAKKTKNVAIKTMTRTASWRLESEADVEKYVMDLKKRLLEELDQDTIVNVEF